MPELSMVCRFELVCTFLQVRTCSTKAIVISHAGPYVRKSKVLLED